MDFIQKLTKLLESKIPFTDIRLEHDAPVRVKGPSGWIEISDMGVTRIDDLDTLLRSVDLDWEERLRNQEALNRPLQIGNWRLRLNAYLARSNTVIAMRRIPQTCPNMKDLGVPAGVRLMLSSQRGLILISGATRSGKSTTAAAMLEVINETRSAHIITIEDPIEYIFKTKKSLFSQREVGIDVFSYQSGLEDALRQCPDVILVGEIRNRETAETALLAGESGHLVIGTLHANTATGAIQKMLNWFNDNERISRQIALSSSLIGVINQVLLPRQDGEGYVLASEILNNYDQSYSPIMGDVVKMQALLERSDEEKKGSILLANSIAELVKSGLVSQMTAVRSVMGMTQVSEKLKTILGEK